MWQYFALRQSSEAETGMVQGRFVGARWFGGHDRIEAVAEMGMAFRKPRHRSFPAGPRKAWRRSKVARGRCV
jgi:hypothetical protein